MITVYTAVFDGYDDLCSVQSSDDVEYVAFTDERQPETGWTCLTPLVTEPDSRRENRKYKTRSHLLFPDSEWTIYLDGNLSLKVTPQEIIDVCLSTGSEAPLFLFPHNLRNCLYDEATACIQAGLDDAETIQPQIDRYRAESYQSNAGLYWGGFLIRRAGCEAFNELWWSEIKRGSSRDQISLPYSLAKSQVTIDVIQGEIPFHGGSNSFVERISHR